MQLANITQPNSKALKNDKNWTLGDGFDPLDQSTARLCPQT
jgi:hypothetical protein